MRVLSRRRHVLTWVHQTAGKLHSADVCRSDVWVGGKNRKEREERKTMKGNSHSRGCGSCVCLFVCLFASLLVWGAQKKKKKKHQTLQDREPLQQPWFRSSQCVVLFAVCCFICCWWLQRGDRGKTSQLGPQPATATGPSPFSSLLLSQLSRRTVVLGGTLCVRDEKTKMRPGCCCSSGGEGSREGSRPRGKKKDVSNYVKVGRKNLLISSEKSVFFFVPAM